MRPIPYQASEFLKKHEGGVMRVYDDLQPRKMLKPGDEVLGTLTGGYGHTGPELHIGMTVTQAMAEGWLLDDLGIAAERLWRRIGPVVEDLTDNQYAALLSFVFNLGVDGNMATATIWRRLRARQFDQVPGEMMRFVRAGGKKLQGLVNRRAAEVALFTSFEPGIEHHTPPSSAVRLMDTPPVPADPVEPKKSATVWAAISAPFLAAFAAVHDWIFGFILAVKDWITPDTVNHGIAAITPYADKSPWVANALQGLAVFGAALAAVLVLRKKNEARR